MHYTSQRHFPLSCRDSNLQFAGPKRPQQLSINFALKFSVTWVNVSFIHSEPQVCAIWLSSPLEHSENSSGALGRDWLFPPPIS